jgi:Esterase/lipase
MRKAALFAFASILSGFAIANDHEPSLGTAHVYKEAGGEPLRVHVIEPQATASPAPRMAIVFFHGGGWVGGKVAQFEEQAQHFARRGAVCFLVQYRFAPRDGVTPPVVCIQDARSAIRWVRRHAERFNLDPSRIAAAGASAGGHLAAHTALVRAMDDPADDLAFSPRPDALLLFNPVLDNGPGEYGAARVGDRVKELSPAHNVDSDAPPTILFLGNKDKLIPVATLERFRDAMQAAGARCELLIYENQEHGFFNASKSREHFALTLAATDDFLQSLGWLPPRTE